jgi:hypothetical protein
VKNTVVIVMSVLIFGSAITAVQVLGYAISMVGFAIYQRGKQVQEAEREREREDGASKA